MRFRGVLAGVVWLVGAMALAQAAGLSPEEFQQKLDRAIELNTTAPWRESQVILEELRPHLDTAGEQQYGEFAYLEARNLTLSGDFEGALKKIESLLERDLTGRQRLRTYRLGANAAIIARRFEKAFTYLRTGLEILNHREDSSYSEGLYGLASYSYAQVGELERAGEFAQLALEESRSTGKPRDLCYAHHQLAFVRKLENEVEDAKHHYESAISQCLEADDELSAAISESGLADLLRQAGDYKLAESRFESALSRLERVEFQSGIAESKLYYARLAEALRQPDKVVALLTPVVDDFASDQTWDYLAEAHRMLGDIARDRGEFASALEHYEARMQARERHLDMERARRIAFLEVDFDLKHTEQQLDLLQEQARVRELEVQNEQQQRRLRMVMYGIFALLIVILFLLLAHTTRERRRFQVLSNRDGLTSLNNHTRFFELAEQSYQSCREKGVPFTLILADIDHFKQVNDRYGHAAGDKALRRVGARLRECFGTETIIGRIGGEEFAIAIPGDRPFNTEQALERFRDSLGEGRNDDTAIPVTMSFGIAHSCDQDKTLTDLRERADEALYRAKRAGRNRVTYAD